MAIQDLDSFLLKFRHLWHCGLDAHLDVDTHAGEAWVGLRVRIGQSRTPPFQSQTHVKTKSRESPSRLRRRARRAASRQEKTDENQIETENVESLSSKESESVATALDGN